MNISGTVGTILNQKGRQVYSILPDATVFQAIQLMAEKNVGALLVVSEHRLLGVISERDYTRKVALKGKSSRETKVVEIISSPVVSATTIAGGEHLGDARLVFAVVGFDVRAGVAFDAEGVEQGLFRAEETHGQKNELGWPHLLGSRNLLRHPLAVFISFPLDLHG